MRGVWRRLEYGPFLALTGQRYRSGGLNDTGVAMHWIDEAGTAENQTMRIAKAAIFR
jgi:hypothetical protein